MSKITVVTASPRKKGNTNAMAAAFIEAAQAKGHEVVRFDTADLTIGGCRACDACAAKGECVFSDDFKAVTDSIMEADGLVIAAPVYWYTFPAQIKGLMDRWYSLCLTERDFAGKKVALMSCCEEPTEETFTGIKFSFEKTMALLNGEVVDEILMTSVNAAGDINNTDGLDRAAALADRF